MIEAGTILTDDVHFEQARSEGVLVEARQMNNRVYGPGKITAYGMYQITIGEKQLLRSVNQFVVVEAK